MSFIRHRVIKPALAAVFTAGLLHLPTVAASGDNGSVFINGTELTPQQIALLQQAMGVALQPGHYLVQNGCVAHLESGNAQCAQPATQAQLSDEDGAAFGQDSYDDEIEEYADGAEAYPYGSFTYDAGAAGYGYTGDLYNDGTYTYSYGNHGYSYQGSATAGGYGYYNNDGSSFHRNSNYAGGYSVGQDSNGCIYTPNWSNC